MFGFTIIHILFVFQFVFAESSIEPETDPVARQQLESLSWVQEQTAAVQSKSFEQSSFKGATPYIVTRSQVLPDGLNPKEFVLQNQVFMFTSQDFRWLCQFALDVLWRRSDPVALVEAIRIPDGEILCYLRI